MVILSVAVICAMANPEEEENSEYFFACSGGEFQTVKTLLEKDPSLVHTTTKDGEHCLHLSALSGNAEIVALLLDLKADPDVRSNWESGLRMHPLSWSTFYGRHEIIELLLKRYWNAVGTLLKRYWNNSGTLSQRYWNTMVTLLKHY